MTKNSSQGGPAKQATKRLRIVFFLSEIDKDYNNYSYRLLSQLQEEQPFTGSLWSFFSTVRKTTGKYEFGSFWS